MQDILIGVLTWISANSSYNVEQFTPNLTFTEPSNICANYGINHKGRCDASQLVAFYNKKNTIYLPLEFNHQSKEDQSILVHELVHYLQWSSNKNKQVCLGKLEVEAYELQDKWRTSHNMESTLDPFKMIMLAASCDD